MAWTWNASAGLVKDANTKAMAEALDEEHAIDTMGPESKGRRHRRRRRSEKGK